MAMDTTLRVLQIVPGTSVDGPGLRTSIYLAGCKHHCPGCHNPLSWDFNAGTQMNVEEIANIVISHGFNVTLTGGDPLQNPNLPGILHLVKLLKAEGLKVWCYTGYTLEHLREHGTEEQKLLLDEVDVLVDGPFLLRERSLNLPWRGSRNQRIIDLKEGHIHA